MLEDCAGSDHLRTVADDLAKAFVLAPQTSLFQRILDNDKDLFSAEGLFKKIETAGANGFDRIGNCAVPGNHDDGNVIVVVTKEPKQVDSIAVGQPYIEEANVGAIGCHACAKLGSRFADENGEALAFEDHLEREPDVGFVVDN